MKNCIIPLLAILLTLHGCVQKNEVSADDVTNPATASGDYDPETLPAFEWDKVEHNYGTVKEGDVVTCTFKYKNIGKSNLIITNAQGSCGCTVPEWNREPIRPGAEGKIDVTFDTEGKAGGENEVIKTVTLFANTNPNRVVLKLKGFVKPK